MTAVQRITMPLVRKSWDAEIITLTSPDDKNVGQAPVFPEGGTWAWLAVLGSFLVYFASFGVINSFGTFQV